MHSRYLPTEAATEPPTQSTETSEAIAGEPTKSPADIARSLLDQPVSELCAQIGEPESSDYASSCMGDGEDGLLFYDGFGVYTYREGDSEIVYDVE